ncbi:ankyrin repeat SOCS box 3 [Fusarium mundagurra]|uniref:Ankyrin repeat SOCS box 3 n=1 Tax=Fusarium mundagurra TaxID=1567541 RepID=A0A8H5Y164_9HYPO|nr:ankyrin repeat SOCS box 3 [Fusarium mundagurra]
MSCEKFDFDSQTIASWVNYQLLNPDGYKAECSLKLDQNIFPYNDFEVDPSTRLPVFKPRQSCVIRVTPLSAAAFLGNEEAVKHLSTFPDPHQYNELISPLSLACLQGHSSIIQLLAGRDAEKNESANTLSAAHIAARKGQSQHIQRLYQEFHLSGISDVDSIPPAIHTLYLDDDEQIKEVISVLFKLDKDALDTQGIWQYYWTCADLARAMRKNVDLVHWLEDKCRSVTN